MERFGWPNVVAIEGDVLPAERRDMSNKIIGNSLAARTQFVDDATEIEGIPEDHGGDGKVEAGSPVSLIFEGAVTDFTEAMKEYRPGERIACLALVESGARPPPQRRVADPIESLA